jgi:pimeloyl-ACP methyl ester carboxylesterase
MRLTRIIFGALLVTASTAHAQRGRPLVLLVHGRGMLDRDTAATRKLWVDGLASGAATITRAPLIQDADVRVAWYADVLDPRSHGGCDYAADDPRARRDARTDTSLKSLASMAGGFLNLISNLSSDKQATTELRGLAADANFLSDVRRRCASEARLAGELVRARADGRPVIVVAHSLGSLVAYDYFSARRDSGSVPELITIGSMAGSPGMRALLIGGDSTDQIAKPAAVRDWVNIHNEQDGFAGPISVARDLVTNPPADELDPHEMVGYLRGTVTAREILVAWCGAFTSNRPQGCKEVISK